MNAPPPPTHRSRKGLWIAVAFLALFLFLSVMLNFGLFIGLFASITPASLQNGAEDEFPSLSELWSYGQGEVRVARIPIEGLLFRQPQVHLFASSRYDRIESILRQIRAARNDDTIRGIILEVDSPGGAITPSDEIYQALMNFKASSEGRMVVVHMKDLAASGAYYVSMAGDWLMAEPTTVVGSIGVIMQALNWKELSDKIGLHATTIKSGANKDLLNPFEPVAPDQVQLLQDVIDTMHARFRGIVADGRDLDETELVELADGRIFSAEVALEKRLIDEIGYWEDVVARTAEMLDVDAIQIIRYEQATRFMDWFAEIRAPFSPAAWWEAATPKMLYLWRP